MYEVRLLLMDNSTSPPDPSALAASTGIIGHAAIRQHDTLRDDKAQRKIQVAKINEMKKGYTVKNIRAASGIYRKLNHVTECLATALKYSRGRVAEKEMIRSVIRTSSLASSKFSKEEGSDEGDDNESHSSTRISFLINCQNECVFYNVEAILESIHQSQKLKNYPILIATSKAKIFKQILRMQIGNLPGLEFVDVTVTDSLKMIYKKVLRRVSTDIVFFTRSLTKLPMHLFNENYTKLLAENSLDVIGAATVSTGNNQNVWDTGCYKTRMLLYQYRIVKGYDELDSNHGVAGCDYLAGPFLARKGVIQRYLDNRYIGIAVVDVPMFRAPDSFFSEEVFYLDLFNHLQTANHLVKVALFDVAATDATSQSPQQGIDRVGQLTREQIQPFMVKNQLSRYTSSVGAGVDYTFDCGEVNINGGAYLMMTNNGMFIPKCAIDELNALLLYSTRIFDDHGFTYELDSGSVVGQTKLSATLPWERDHDLVFKPNHFRRLARLNNTFVSVAGYTQHAKFDELDLCLANRSMECGYVGIRSKTWRIELVGQSVIGSDMYGSETNKLYTNARQSLYSSTVSGKTMKATTRGQVGGQWISIPPNPGLYSRSKYGLDVLRHQQHWADVGGINSWMSYDNVGKWMKCKRPGHHSCSNNFLADGNLIFNDVWL